jgi:hypothetical protein
VGDYSCRLGRCGAPPTYLSCKPEGLKPEIMMLLKSSECSPGSLLSMDSFIAAWMDGQACLINDGLKRGSANMKRLNKKIRRCDIR